MRKRRKTVENPAKGGERRKREKVEIYIENNPFVSK